MRWAGVLARWPSHRKPVAHPAVPSRNYLGPSPSFFRRSHHEHDPPPDNGFFCQLETVCGWPLTQWSRTSWRMSQQNMSTWKNWRQPVATKIGSETAQGCWTSYKAFFAANMKCAAFIFVSFVLASQALAVLRPVFPVKPSLPYSGEVIIGDDLVRVFAKAGPLNRWLLLKNRCRNKRKRLQQLDGCWSGWSLRRWL